MMTKNMKSRVISRVSRTRRSVVLSKAVADELETILEQNPGQNVNRLMNTALEEFIQRRRQREFELAMAEMAADPAVRKECSRIRRQFCTTDMDGLEK